MCDLSQAKKEPRHAIWVGGGRGSKGGGEKGKEFDMRSFV